MNPLSAIPQTLERVAARLAPAYRLRLAAGARDIQAAQALRFEVFNLELDEGLAQSYDTGLDADPFDAVCDHLLVEDETSGAVVGTYRLQTGRAAGSWATTVNASSTSHRSSRCANSWSNWAGPASTAPPQFCGAQPAVEGHRHYARAARAPDRLQFAHLAGRRSAPRRSRRRRTWRRAAPHPPVARFACSLDARSSDRAHPALLSAYLAMGAAICGPPAIDREFRTIDFLTCVDLRSKGIATLLRRWGIQE